MSAGYLPLSAKAHRTVDMDSLWLYALTMGEMRREIEMVVLDSTYRAIAERANTHEFHIMFMEIQEQMPIGGLPNLLNVPYSDVSADILNAVSNTFPRGT